MTVLPMQPPTDEFKILREQKAAEQRVLDEQAPFNVALTVCAGIEIQMLANIANDMEANGDEPRIVFMRDDRHRVIGLTLVGHVVSMKAAEADAMRAEVEGGR